MKFNIKIFFTFSFWFELFLFVFTQFLAAGVAFGLVKRYPSQPIIQTTSSPWLFILAIVTVTAILILILKYMKHSWLVQSLFILTIVEGLWIFGNAYFDWPLPVYFLAAIAFFYFIYRNILIHDAVIIMSIAAISAIFGLNLISSAVIIILIFLALYDFWSVYKTQHMVEMFRGLAKRKVYLSLIVPQTLKGIFKNISEASPQTEFMFLGTGDLAIPAIFLTSCLRISLLTSLFVGLGATLGFIFLFVLFVTQKERQPMPGLPPIILGSLLGFLISFLIK